MDRNVHPPWPLRRTVRLIESGDLIKPLVYSGEIYLPAHRGCYTTQAALKRGNRCCEFMLREAELRAAALAEAGRLEARAVVGGFGPGWRGGNQRPCVKRK